MAQFLDENGNEIMEKYGSKTTTTFASIKTQDSAIKKTPK
jgi:hypothetical protein